MILVDLCQSELKSTHDFVEGYTSFFQNPNQATRILDTASFWLKKTGGTWFAFKKWMNLLWYKKHAFSISESWSFKGDLHSIQTKKKS